MLTRCGAIETGDFTCPVCLGSVRSGTTELACERCGRAFAVNEGIVDFRERFEEYYFNPVPQREMQQLIDGMSEVSWEETVRKFVAMAANKRQAVDNLVVNGRYAWQVFLNLTPGSKVLDFGCGLGNLTQNVAPRVGHVFALDRTMSRVRFTQRRLARFEYARRVTVVSGGDGERLPFREDTFDCVLMSGVLEWLGDGVPDDYERGSRAVRLSRMLVSPFGRQRPSAKQLRWLKEVRRVLKPDGELFIAIENRFNAQYFKSLPDHHSRLMYASLMPRAMANLYSMLLRRRPYRTYTHSMNGYRRLLRSAGFAGTQFVGLFEGYSFLREMVPLSDSSRRPRLARTTKVRERIRRIPFFVPAFGIIAGVPDCARRSTFEEVLKAVGAAVGGRAEPHGVRCTQYLVTAKDKLVVRAVIAGCHVVIRIALTQAASRDAGQNAKMLEWLGLHRPGFRGAPLALCCGEAGGMSYFCESECRGLQLRELLPGRDREWATAKMRRALDQMASLNSKETASGIFDSDMCESLVLRPIETAAGLFATEREGIEIGKRLADGLAGARLPFGLMHGDLSASNILVGDDQGLGFVDWGTGAVQGLTVMDAICLLLSVQQGASAFPESISLLARNRWPQREERLLLSEEYERYGVEEKAHFDLVHLFWLHAIAHRRGYGLGFDPVLVEEHVRRVARSYLAGH